MKAILKGVETFQIAMVSANEKYAIKVARFCDWCRDDR